jgi:tetratricopeptide (TPR) repeat protein
MTSARALSRVREVEQLLDDTGAILAQRGGGYYALGRACLLLGRLDEARRLDMRTIESTPWNHGTTAHGFQLLGDVAIHPDRFDAESGQSHYREALALAEPRRMLPVVAHCHLGLGKLYLRTDRREQAREHLATATTMYRETGMTYWLEKAEAETRDLR